MSLLSILVLLLLTIIDFLVLIVFTIVKDMSYFYMAIFLHILVYIVFRWYKNKYLYEYQNIPTLFVLFFPGLGWIIVDIIYISLLYFVQDSILISEYEKLITHSRDVKGFKEIDYSKFSKLMSYTDQMHLLSTREKKFFIIEATEKKYTKLNDILNYGLNDIDPEIKYYSANSLNAIRQEIEDDINKLIITWNETKNTELIYKIIDSIEKYINSNNISKDMSEFYNLKYIEILNEANLIMKDNISITKKILDALYRAKSYKYFNDINTMLMTSHDNDIDLWINKLKYFHATDKYKDLSSAAIYIIDNFKDIPKEYNEFIRFWGKEG